MKNILIIFFSFFFFNGAWSAPNYCNLEPGVGIFIKNLSKQAGPPIYTLSPVDARKILDDLQASFYNTVPALVTDITIPGGPTKEISATIIRPLNATGPLPIILFIHGGGWILGNQKTHDRLVRELANGAQAAVVFINYTPSPDARFPVALEQAYTVLEYITKSGRSLQLDPNRIAIVGDSVGGNMATVLTMMVKDRNGPLIKQQILFYPVTDANFNTGSYRQFADGYWLSKKAMQWFWDAYLPNKADRKKPYASPLQATIEQLKGLPPTLIIVDEHDVLRDEGEAYARKLMQAGVSVTTVRILGTVHDFVMLDPLKNTNATRGAIDMAICTLKKIFYE